MPAGLGLSLSGIGLETKRPKRITKAMIDKVSQQQGLNPKEKAHFIRLIKQKRVPLRIFGIEGEDERTLRRITKLILIEAGILLPTLGGSLIAPPVGAVLAGTAALSLVKDYAKDRRKLSKSYARRARKTKTFFKTKSIKRKKKIFKDFGGFFFER